LARFKVIGQDPTALSQARVRSASLSALVKAYRLNTGNLNYTEFQKAPEPQTIHDRVDPGSYRTIVGVAQTAMVTSMLTTSLDNSSGLQPADETSIFCPGAMGPFMNLIAVCGHYNKEQELPAKPTRPLCEEDQRNTDHNLETGTLPPVVIDKHSRFDVMQAIGGD
jgi:hypothetical protein